jgi:hypothetical protein
VLHVQHCYLQAQLARLASYLENMLSDVAGEGEGGLCRGSGELFLLDLRRIQCIPQECLVVVLLLLR